MSTKTSKMAQGDTVTVTAGEFKGLTATIIDPSVVPDHLPNRRKILVAVEGEECPVYLLPRLLDTGAQRPVSPGVAMPHPEQGIILLPGDITDADDPRLDPWRPDPSIVKQYVNRTVPGGMTDTEFLLKFWQKRENVLLVGDTQSGKTMLVQVLSVLAGKKRDSGKPLPVFTLSGSSGVTDFDLFGQPTAYTTPEGGERLVWLPGVVDLATRVKDSILYCDEVNMMSERVTASLHSLFDHRRQFVNRQKAVRTVVDGQETFAPEVVQADGMWVIGTINPAGYKGVAMGEAFLNRFTHIPWGYDSDVERRLIPSSAIRLFGQAMREARANKAIGTPVGTAALQRACQHAEEFGPEAALWMLTGMFTPQERPKVEAIITDRAIRDLLVDEAAAREAALS